METSTSVLIVGGSLNGLTAALLLARRGVACLVVERHSRPSIQYKFRGISPRSMEIYRSAGIEAEIRARDLIDDRAAYVARMKNLAAGCRRRNPSETITPSSSAIAILWAHSSMTVGTKPTISSKIPALLPAGPVHARRIWS